jgi:hypothetical protein
LTTATQQDTAHLHTHQTCCAHHFVCCCEVDAHSSCHSAHQEQEDAAAAIELVNKWLPRLLGRRAVKPHIVIAGALHESLQQAAIANNDSVFDSMFELFVIEDALSDFLVSVLPPKCQ